ncbi:2Fe-2S iron-sulfur cluster-binding protein [Paraburkholderia aspalathi]|uniref:2Fe-2S iron-sulfur cluster-binding protein n=1 Tax=Paraburkholderia aspalathi TaxID=1324617 RepID=UPI001BA8D0DE|nr:2Fe-2S iron-sulfur cluster-binding protein [Paraburkholderia aspalathi]
MKTVVPRSHWITILPSGVGFACYEGEAILDGISRAGKKNIPVGCANGGCGICKVVVRRGIYFKLGAMSRAHVSEDDETRGVVLACKVSPQSPLDLTCIGKLENRIYRHGMLNREGE